MKQYKDWAPTANDIKGLACGDRQDWLVCPVSITRDTPDHALDKSNYEVLLKELTELDPDNNDHEVHSFNHWGPGWFNIILVRPDSPCAKFAQECEDSLSDYPILDDDDFSMRECEAACEAWEAMDVEERLNILESAGYHNGYAALIDVIPRDDNGAIHEALLEY